MAKYKSRASKRNKNKSSRRSRKQYGGFFGPFVDKIKGLFGSNGPDLATTAVPHPLAETDDPNPKEPTGQTQGQGGGYRKKTKKRYHRRHRK